MKPSTILVSVLLVACLGCEKIVSEEKIGAPFQEENIHPCQYTGDCYGLSFSGKYEFGPSAFCSGNQTDVEIVQRYKVRYESGRTEVEERTVETIKEGWCS